MRKFYDTEQEFGPMAVDMIDATFPRESERDLSWSDLTNERGVF